MNSLQPRVTQIEEEQTYKLLMPSERSKGLEIRYNMNAMLRADNKSRAEYYRAMRDASIYSVNDVRRLEDMSDVAGGEERRESLNYVPLSMWPKLSIQRNTTKNGGETSETESAGGSDSQ
jgi:phage portal protein BeeE